MNKGASRYLQKRRGSPGVQRQKSDAIVRGEWRDYWNLKYERADRQAEYDAESPQRLQVAERERQLHNELENQRRRDRERKYHEAIARGKCIPPGGRVIVEVPKQVSGVLSQAVRSIGGKRDNRT